MTKKIKHQDWLIAGIMLGLVIQLVLPPLIGWLVSSSGISGITFATYNVRQELAAFADAGNAFASWAGSYVGLGWSLEGFLMSAIGLGALAFGVAWLFDLLKVKVKPKNKMFWVFVLSSLISGFVVSKTLPEFAIAPILFLGATAFLATYILKWVYKLLKMPLPK